MTINYTTLLGLAEPVTGTESGTWGDDVNKGITDYLDIAIAGTQAISGSQTAVTLSVTNGSSAGSNIAQVGSGSSGSSQYAIINCTGNPASLLTITAPASSKSYVIINATSTSQSVKIVGSGPTTGVTVVSGEKAIVSWNGSDFVKVASSVITNFTGVLLTTNGGTGLSSFTAGDLPYYATGTALSKLGIGTTGYFLTSSGSAPQWTQTLGVANGGTGLNSLTANYIPYGNGTSALSSSSTFTFNGTTLSSPVLSLTGTSALAAFRTPNILEISTVSATAATGTINYDVTTQSVLYYTTNASGNFTLNFRGSSGTSLNTIMNTGDTVTVTFLCTNGSTAYYNSAVTIDGSSVTPKWQGGTAPTSGNASAVDAYTYAIIKTGSATFTVLASQTKFA